MAKRTPIPFREIAKQALGFAESLLPKWIGGKRVSGEWQAEHRASGGLGDSLTVNLTKGKWIHGSADKDGGDLVSLYAYVFGLKMNEAAIEVADQIGFKLPDGCIPDGEAPKERTKPVVDPSSYKPAKEKEESPWHPITPVPAEAPEAPLAHPRRGLPALKWEYKDADGQLLGYVYRFNTSDGGKETLPLTYCKNDKTGAFDWRWMQWEAPNRPLYGLDRLAAKPDAYVLLVSGEKCADAPLELLKKCAIVTWPGGDKAVDKIDWEPLAGCNIYAWPDCDAHREKLTKQELDAGIDPNTKPLLPEHEQSGIKAMLKVRDKLLALNPNTQFKLVDIPKPGQVPSGWDIADAINEGWDANRLRNFILNTREYRPDINTAESKSTPNPAKAEGGESSTFNWRNTLACNGKGIPLDSRENVFIYLNNHPDMKGLIAFDEFSLRLVKTRPTPWDAPFEGDMPWDDNDSLELALWMAQVNDLSIRSMDNINHAVKLAAWRNKFDPLVNYLDGLVWDGKPRMQTWLTDYAGVLANEYSRIAGIMFLIGMVARAYRPGCIMRTMPVFEGVQYRGKSSIARILAGKWFSDSPIELKGKDGFINIQGIWLQEIAEMGSFNNQEAPIIKAYLSSASDRFRSPFDKYARDYPRRTVFFGTTNEDQYLRDKTGNSRFWPFRTEEVSSIDLEGLVLARDQLFAEAVHMFKQGERWHPTEQQQNELFSQEQSLREYDDPWEEKIAAWLHTSTFYSTSVSEVLTDCLKIETGKQTNFNAIQVGKILTRLGWKKRRPTEGDDAKRPRKYMRPESDPVVLTMPKDDEDDSIPF